MHGYQENVFYHYILDNQIFLNTAKPEHFTNTTLRELFDIYIKTVIDVERKICSAGADRHFESEKVLLEDGSRQSNLWGGGVDTQKVLPFGTPTEVRDQVLERCRVFSKDGGFIFNTIHNIQARTPVENIVAMLDAIQEFGGRN